MNKLSENEIKKIRKESNYDRVIIEGLYNEMSKTSMELKKKTLTERKRKLLSHQKGFLRQISTQNTKNGG